MIRNTHLDFATNLDLDPESILPLCVIDRPNVLGSKYELKELQINVYDMFWRGRPSDKEWRGQRFALYECFLVLDCHAQIDEVDGVDGTFAKLIKSNYGQLIVKVDQVDRQNIQVNQIRQFDQLWGLYYTATL